MSNAVASFSLAGSCIQKKVFYFLKLLFYRFVGEKPLDTNVRDGTDKGETSSHTS